MLRKTALAAATFVALGASSTAFAGGRPDLVLQGISSGKARFVPGEMLVKFTDGSSEADRAAVRRGLGAARVQTVRGGKAPVELLRLPPGLEIANAVRALSGDRAIEYAEPNWIYTHAATSNDPYVTNGTLWGMTGAFGSQAQNAWSEDKQDCGNVIVGVIDEGFMHGHDDLAANVWLNPFDAADGIDNDGNGKVDDVRGWDFAANDSSTFDGVGDDHGTHVAGTIGGKGGNATGVAGVCWSGIKMISAKFLGSTGGTTANAIAAVNYLTDLKTRHGLNIVATNNSWGGGGFSQALKDAIDAAGAADILFIAAAGNSAVNNDTTPHYPSSYTSSNIISVASITSTGGLSSFSQWGLNSVDLGAPGSSIMSTVPVTSGKGRRATVVSGYASYNGTSMATPHVTGAVALFKAQNPAASAATIKAAILNSAVPTPSLTGKTVTGGRLDVSSF